MIITTYESLNIFHVESKVSSLMEVYSHVMAFYSAQ